LCVDFDGVLHSYEMGWQGAGIVGDPPVPGAMTWLVACVQAFDEVCIYSSRSKEEAGVTAMKEAIERWMVDERLMSEAEAYDFTEEKLSFPTEKPAAWLTIDDRAICFTGPPFPSMQSMLEFRPWNKRVAKAR